VWGRLWQPEVRQSGVFHPGWSASSCGAHPTPNNKIALAVKHLRMGRNCSRDSTNRPLVVFRKGRHVRASDDFDEGSTLLQAALAAGFGSYSQCHRVFQATLGCTPRVFFASPIRRAIEDRFAPLAPG
jgi:hypothetical protein